MVLETHSPLLRSFSSTKTHFSLLLTTIWQTKNPVKGLLVQRVDFFKRKHSLGWSITGRGNHRPSPSCGLAKQKKKLAYKPGFVVNSHSSRRPITQSLKQPTRERREPRQCSPIWSCSGWGFTCRPRYRVRGALLPHLFTLTSPVCTGLRRFKFLYHYPWPHGLRSLTGIPLCGARTFLPAPRCAATVQPASGGILPEYDEKPDFSKGWKYGRNF